MIDLRANFNAWPCGPLTDVGKSQVFGGVPLVPYYNQKPDPAVVSIYDADRTGNFFSIAPGGRSGGNCMKLFYPAGSFGMRTEFFQLQLGRPNAVVNVEWDWMFDVDFDFHEGGGKIAPAINWGSIASGPTGGVRLMPVWSGAMSLIDHQPWSFAVQNQQNGGQVPPNYAPAQIERGRWYRAHLQMLGGLPGVCRAWLDGYPQLNITMPYANTASDDPVFVDFATFFGGVAANATARDCHAYMDDVHVYTSPCAYWPS